MGGQRGVVGEVSGNIAGSEFPRARLESVCLANLSP